jgi:hypothetical protein
MTLYQYEKNQSYNQEQLKDEQTQPINFSLNQAINSPKYLIGADKKRMVEILTANGFIEKEKKEEIGMI